MVLADTKHLQKCQRVLRGSAEAAVATPSHRAASPPSAGREARGVAGISASSSAAMSRAR